MNETHSHKFEQTDTWRMGIENQAAGTLYLLFSYNENTIGCPIRSTARGIKCVTFCGTFGTEAAAGVSSMIVRKFTDLFVF
jgi:hypothetical protein